MRSLRLDVGRADHLAPFFGFVGEQLAEVGGRPRKHSSPHISKQSLHPGISETGVDFCVEPSDDFGGRIFGCGKALPTTPFPPPPPIPHSRHPSPYPHTPHHS